MARLFVAVSVALGGGLLWAALRSPAFDAARPSPALVRSLAPDYLAIDALYGESTSPTALGSALRWYLPADSTVSGIEIWRPLSSAVFTAAQGAGLAGEGERAVESLGATAELGPARRELLASYAEATQAWQLEGQIVRAVERDPQGPRLAGYGSATAAGAATMATIRRAGQLHDEAMTAIRALAAASGAADGAVAATLPQRGQ